MNLVDFTKNDSCGANVWLLNGRACIGDGVPSLTFILSLETSNKFHSSNRVQALCTCVYFVKLRL